MGSTAALSPISFRGRRNDCLPEYLQILKLVPTGLVGHRRCAAAANRERGKAISANALLSIAAREYAKRVSNGEVLRKCPGTQGLVNDLPRNAKNRDYSAATE